MISGFRNLYDKEPMEMTVARFVDWIRTNGEVKRLTEEYRRLTAKGSEGEAARVKRALPAATLAAVFEGGRQEKDLKRLTGLMMFDWDHVGAARTQLLERLRMTDCVMLAWTSVSGEGVKAVIRVDVTSTGSTSGRIASWGDGWNSGRDARWTRRAATWDACAARRTTRSCT